jgi:hypothetical protein
MTKFITITLPKPIPVPGALCRTCAHEEFYRYVLSGKKIEGKRCRRTIVAYPATETCKDYEREAGVD